MRFEGQKPALFGFVCLLILWVGCSTPKVGQRIGATPKVTPQLLVESAAAALQSQNLSNAVAPLIALTGYRDLVLTPDPAELETQFWLFTCRPQRAWRASERIRSAALRSLAQATIASAVALSEQTIMETRWEGKDLSQSERGFLRKRHREQVRLDVSLPMDFESGEVWSDEWATLTHKPKDCVFPKADASHRQALLSFATKEFENPEVGSLVLGIPEVALLRNQARKAFGLDDSLRTHQAQALDVSVKSVKVSTDGRAMVDFDSLKFEAPSEISAATQTLATPNLLRGHHP